MQQSLRFIRFRSIAAWASIGSILLQVNAALLCLLLFSIQQDTLSKTVCERKTQSCHGTCFLLKKLRSVNEQSDSSNGEQHVHFSTLISAEYLVTDQQLPDVEISDLLLPKEQDAEPLSGFGQPALRPPKA